MNIIGFGHKKRVGKNEAAKLLSIYLNKKILADWASDKNRVLGAYELPIVEIVGFADKLYHVTHDLFGIYGIKNKDFYEHNDKEQELEIGLTPRKILISVGCKMREIIPDIWIDHALGERKNVHTLIISDVRFPNEIEAIHKVGGKVVKILRPSIADTDDQADTALDNFDYWDATIINDGSLEKFHKKIINVYEDLFDASD